MPQPPQALADSLSPSSGERRPHRILHVIFSMSPRDGGPPESVRQLAANYRAIGDEVEVVTLDDPSSTFLGELDFPVHALGPAPVGYGVSARLVKWLAAHVPRFNLVVINGVWLFHSVAAWRAATNAGVPYFVFTHGALDVFFRKRYPVKHLKKMIYWPLQYTILQQAAAVLFTSETERDFAAASFWPRRWNSVVIPYGTNKPSGAMREKRAFFYDKVPAVRERRFLLFLSRLHEKKGCDLLIDAFSKAGREEPDLQLVMAGPDQVGLQSKLQAQARSLGVADRLHWPGMLEGEAKFGAFAAAEAFVLPSHQENFGIAVAESLACGTPVLISDQVNIWRDIVQDGVGFVEPDTTEGTLRLLRRWLDAPLDERSAMAARAMATFEARYSLRRAAETIHALTAALPSRRISVAGFSATALPL